MDDTTNITLRKHQLAKSKSLEGNMNKVHSLDSSPSFDLLGKSLDLSTNLFPSSFVEEMKSEITSLKSNLQSTQNEMDNLILENVELKKQVSQLSQEIVILKQICRSPTSTWKNNIISSSRKNSVKRRLTDDFHQSPLTLGPKNGMGKETIKPLAQAVQASETNDQSAEITQACKISDFPTQPQHFTDSLNDNQSNFEKDSSLNDNPSNIEKNVETRINVCSGTNSSSTLLNSNNDNVSRVTMKLSSKQTSSKEIDSSRIFLFGGKQCLKMSKTLKKSRERTPYKQYRVISFIKPYASTEEILNCTKLFDITPDDRIIVCVGQHDSNVLKIMTELCIFLKITQCPIFVLKVFNNVHLNEFKLNEMLKLLSNQNKNCNFINFDDNLQLTMNDICKRINSTLDQVDYNLKFLNYKTTSTRTGNNNVRLNNTDYSRNIQVNKVNQCFKNCPKIKMVDCTTQTEHYIVLQDNNASTSANTGEFFRD